MGSQVITTTGTTTWTWPAGVSSVTVELVGGGGGGGSATGNPSAGGGGKGGSYARGTVTKGAETTLSIAVGAGGAVNGVGGTSSVTQVSTVVIRAGGGQGGSTASTNNGSGNGGTIEGNASIGTVTFLGGNGGIAAVASTSGGGGGAASPSGAGNAASGGTQGFAKGGNFLNGTAYSGGGAGGVTGDTAGFAGATYGGGASGGKATSAADRLGGVGGQGIAVLTWTDPIPQVLTQDAYGFYEEGAENTSPQITTVGNVWSLDLTAGNKNFYFRARIQESGGGGGLGTDDYQIYYSVNGGSYIQAATSGVIDFLGGTSTTNAFLGASNTGYGQGFTGNGATLGGTRGRFIRQGTLTGNVVSKIYNTSGTFGSGSIPTGTALATSDPVPVMNIPTTDTQITFPFSGTNRIVLTNAAKYCVTYEYAGGDTTTNFIKLYNNQTTSAHNGNYSAYNGTSWSALATWDIIFQVDSIGSTEVVPVSSGFFTEGTPTNQRLPSGNGTYVQGKASIDGEVNDLLLSANNFTEVLFNLSAVKTAIPSGATIDFRVYKNGSPLNTYSVTPRIATTGGTGTGTTPAIVVRRLGLMGVG